MPIHDFSCFICGNTEERFVWPEFDWVPCSTCQGEMKKLFSFGQSQPIQENANWLPSVLEVVDKESRDPVDKVFLKDPTRTNYLRWMKHHGLRPLDNERGGPPTAKKQVHDLKSITDYCYEQKRKRERIEVR
jgi:hypothetical protein